uniref:TATA box-binding protein-associated factor RNA polymerase I subunit B n=1 Tax=Lutzomyia longipalpis TaxID=7200 RepID=A0A1B0C8Z1_LUTLO
MVAHGKCEVCGCTNFNMEGGFYYCSECNTQNQNIREMEVDALDMTMGDVNVRVQGVRLREERQEKIELTSWEEYNYILIGLVNEAIALGAPAELKKTALQLWTRYLQRINAAFFRKHDIGIPKLPTRFFPKDAKILYNASKKLKRRRSASVSTRSTMSLAKSLKKNRVLQMARAKTKKALMKEQMELESNAQSQPDGTSATSPTQTMSTKSTKTGRTTIPLAYTSRARRSLKRRMPKQHIKKHSEDTDFLLECHKPNSRYKTAEEHIETVSKTVLLGILNISLNLTKSDIQICDLLRFLREGHISIFNIEHFFPENVLEKTRLSSFAHLVGIHSFPTYNGQADVVRRLCNFLHVPQLINPDFVGLVHRFVQELFYIPHHVPRAMAYILFGLKLFFGLDGVTEKKMSESAEAANELIRKFNLPHGGVFSWDEWVKYIEMRSIILTEYHMPTNILWKGDASGNTQRYAEYLKYCKRSTTTRNFIVSKIIYEVYEKLSTLRGMNPEEKSSKSFIFEPSLTPLKSYMEYLVENHREHLKIPEMMLVDHSQRSIEPFHRPRRFCNQMAERNIKINLKRAPENEKVAMQIISKKRGTRKLIQTEIVEKEEDENYFLGLEDFQKVQRTEKKPSKRKKSVIEVSDIDSETNSEDSMPLLQRLNTRKNRKKARWGYMCDDSSSGDCYVVGRKDFNSSDSSVCTDSDVSAKVTRRKVNKRKLNEEKASQKKEEPKKKQRRAKHVVHVEYSGHTDGKDLHQQCETNGSAGEPASKKRMIAEEDAGTLENTEDQPPFPDISDLSIWFTEGFPSCELDQTQDILPDNSESQMNYPMQPPSIDLNIESQDLFSVRDASLMTHSTYVPSIDILPETSMDPGEKILKRPRWIVERTTLFNDMSDADDVELPQLDAKAEEMTFFTPNFNYWHHFLPIDARTNWGDMSYDEYGEFFPTLPPSFMWLLKHCAKTIEAPMRVLYHELLTIEKEFTFVIDSVDNIKTRILKRRILKKHQGKHFTAQW